MGNYSEFRRVYSIVEKRTDFDANINVSVFETNIRIVGGLLAAHLVARRAGIQVVIIIREKLFSQFHCTSGGSRVALLRSLTSLS